MKSNNYQTSKVQRPGPGTQVQSNLESLFLIILILIGLLGALYFLNPSNNPQNQSKEKESQIIDQPTQYTTTPGAGKARLASLKTNQHLLISRTREQGVPVIFEISGFNKNAEYVLDLGNGKTSKLKTKKAKYTYRTAGKYKVTLSIKYHGKTKTLHSEVLNIQSPKMLAQGT